MRFFLRDFRISQDSCKAASSRDACTTDVRFNTFQGCCCQAFLAFVLRKLKISHTNLQPCDAIRCKADAICWTIAVQSSHSSRAAAVRLLRGSPPIRHIRPDKKLGQHPAPCQQCINPNQGKGDKLNPAAAAVEESVLNLCHDALLHFIFFTYILVLFFLLFVTSPPPPPPPPHTHTFSSQFFLRSFDILKFVQSCYTAVYFLSFFHLQLKCCLVDDLYIQL